MNHFVNYRKRSIQLPKGCKNLSDLLSSSKKSQDGGKSLFKSIGEDKCVYCGAPPVAGWASCVWGADGSKADKFHLWCERCQEDLGEFESRPENKLPELPDVFDLHDPKVTEPLERLMNEIEMRKDAFMRQRVAERKRSNDAI